MSPEFHKISALVLALLAFGVAELIGGNGFVAAFCMGVTAGNIGQNRSNKILREYVEIEVELLILLTFMIFGAVLLPPALDQVNGSVVLYAVISLTLIRMIPVAISLIGTRVNPVRGLYSLMFGTPIAALTTGPQFMYVSKTGALAVTVGGILATDSQKGNNCV
jgi:NhaP-type Na+/H+ or K+/H+ antiporter